MSICITSYYNVLKDIIIDDAHQHENFEKIREISILAKKSFDERQQLGKCGACEILINAFNFNLLENIKSVSHCFDFLDCLCSLSGCQYVQLETEYCIDNILTLLNHGICDIIIWSLENNKNKPNIVTAGFRVIRALAYGNRNDQVEFNTENIILESFRECIDSADVCESACWAIMSLAYSDSMSTKFGASGACEIIVEVIQRYILTNEYNVVLAACWAIRNLTGTNIVNTRKFQSSGIEKVLLTLLQSDSLSATLLESICAAIGGLSFDDNIAQSLGNQGICEALVSGLQQFPDSSAIASVGCEAMRNLSACENPEDNIAKLMKAGADQVLIQILTLHHTIAEVTIMATRAVGNIALVEEHKPQLVELGVMEVVKSVADSDYWRNITCTDEKEKQELTSAIQSACLVLEDTAAIVEEVEDDDEHRKPTMPPPAAFVSMKSFKRRYCSGFFESILESGEVSEEDDIDNDNDDDADDDNDYLSDTTEVEEEGINEEEDRNKNNALKDSIEFNEADQELHVRNRDINTAPVSRANSNPNLHIMHSLSEGGEEEMVPPDLESSTTSNSSGSHMFSSPLSPLLLPKLICEPKEVTTKDSPQHMTDYFTPMFKENTRPLSFKKNEMLTSSSSPTASSSASPTTMSPDTLKQDTAIPNKKKRNSVKDENSSSRSNSSSNSSPHSQQQSRGVEPSPSSPRLVLPQILSNKGVGTTTPLASVVSSTIKTSISATILPPTVVSTTSSSVASHSHEESKHTTSTRTPNYNNTSIKGAGEREIKNHKKNIIDTSKTTSSTSKISGGRMYRPK